MHCLSWLVRCRIGSRLGVVVLALFVVGLAGCNTSNEAQVGGKVTYAGSPVTSGQVNFLSREKGIGAMAPLNSSGDFQLPDAVEPGKYAVYVTPPQAEPAPPGVPATPPPASNIPQKARDPNTSGVEVSVQAGENKLTIDLKD